MSHTPRLRRALVAALALSAAATLPADAATPVCVDGTTEGKPVVIGCINVPSTPELVQLASEPDLYTAYRAGIAALGSADGIASKAVIAAVKNAHSFGITTNSDAFAEIMIRQVPGALAPSHVAPGVGSTPSDWSCTSGNVNSVYTVTCSPDDPAPVGSWVCPGPYVLATYLGSFLDTHEGSTGCGGTTVTCSPQQNPLVANFCEDSAGSAGMSFSCEADFAGITATTVEWTVLCRTFTST